MVLLHAAACAVDRSRLIVATFDHGTGDFATGAVDLVRDAASQAGVQFATERTSRPLHSEADFRAARWSFLHRIASENAAQVVTAHTRDDQIETVLMRALRGAGARGLAGLFASSDVLRPLLAFSRSDITAYANSHGISWLEDPSNTAPAHLRNRVRHDLLPALRAVAPSIDEDLLNIARDAAAWRDDVDAFIRAHVDIRRLPDDRGLDVDTSIARFTADRAAILWPAILASHRVVADRRGIQRLARFGAAARVGARMQLSGGWQIVRSRDALQLRASTDVDVAHEATLTPLALSKPTTWSASSAPSGVGDWSFRAIEAASPDAADVGRDAWSAWLPADRLLGVRAWRAGDTMVPAPGRSPRKIKHLLSEAGVSGHQRAGWPVVLAGDEIVWVPGVRQAPALAPRTAQSGLPFLCDYFDRHRDR